MNFKSALCVFCTCFFTIVTSVHQVHAADYTIIDLGVLGGTSSYGNDINSSGQVAGSIYIPSSSLAFLFDGSTMHDLGTVPDGLDTYGIGINDNGHVTGYSEVQGSTSYLYYLEVFLYDGSTMRSISRPAGVLNSFGRDINVSDKITGDITFPSSDDPFIDTSHAFIYDGNSTHDLGTLGGRHSVGYGINDNGYVAGWSDVIGDSKSMTDTTDVTHAFIYDGNSMQSIGTLGGKDSEGRDINNNGWVAGNSDVLPDDARHAFLYNGSSMLDLGTLGGENSYGHGINNNGHVVGYSQLASAEYTAFLYADNRMFDLCELTDCSANGWDSLYIAFGINDRGDITGYGKVNGNNHAFVILAGDLPPPPSSAVPVANNDNTSVNVDTAKVINVIANDMDVEDGAPPSAPPAFVTPTTSASTQGFAISANSNGTITYTPTGGFTGTDNFKYTLTDSDGQVSTPATVYVAVSAVPVFTAPVANNDTVSVKVDTVKEINVIANDTDLEDGSPPLAPPAVVTPTTATSTQGFAILANANGTISYMPTGGFTGADSFKYALTDSDGQVSATAIVNVTVSVDPVFAAPVAIRDTVSVKVDTVKEINVIANDIDLEDGSPPLAPPAVITPTTATSTQGFAISANANGTITYTPTGGFTGTDKFKYTLTDSDGQVSAPATVNVIVSVDPVFTAPVAVEDTVSVKVDTVKEINVIANDTDLEDGSPPLAPPAVVTPTTATSTQGFAISANANGTISYTPTGGFTGTDSFKYALTDSDDQVSMPVTVYITVSADAVPVVGANSDSGGGLTLNLLYLLTILGLLTIGRYKLLYKCY